jgi:Ferritin-like
VPASLLPQMRSLVIAPAAAPEAPVAPPMACVKVPLPNLSAYPTARDKAKILLESAAEVEHALMVQYLYAAYSLKSKDQVDVEHETLLDWDDESGQSWPLTLLAIAREEMGHLMSVENLLILLGLAPNFEREDSPPRTDLYPFPLRLQPLTRSSLAKYVVAEAPWDVTDIDDIIYVANAKAGSTINHVGILYGLLGMVFCREDQIDGGASGHPRWDAILRLIRDAASKQDPAPEHWHLADGEFRPGTLERQADPADWNIPPLRPQVRVHRVADRANALDAIRDIGEQGEGPSSEGQASHFERFRRIYRSADGQNGFPEPGMWAPTRPVPIDPKVTDFTDPRTRGWAELADARYGLLLGFLYHYLFASGDVRRILTGWIFAEMRSRLGFIARELTAMPASADPNSCAGIPFTLPRLLTLPDDEATWWCVHVVRTAEAIAIAQRLRSADTPDPFDEFLTNLLASDQARLKTMKEHAGPTTTSFVRDIAPLFRPKDIDHMREMTGLDLANFEMVKARARGIIRLVQDGEDDTRMPKPPGQSWTPTQVKLVQQWVTKASRPKRQ